MMHSNSKPRKKFLTQRPEGTKTQRYELQNFVSLSLRVFVLKFLECCANRIHLEILHIKNQYKILMKKI